MKKIIVFSVIALCLIMDVTKAQKAIPAQADSFYKKAMPQINAKHLRWIKSTAANPANKEMTENGFINLTTGYANGLNISGGDIEALAFLIMMEAAKSAQQDLKEIMDGVKKTNEQKKKLRDAMQRLKKNEHNLSRAMLDSFNRLTVSKVTTTAGSKPISTAKTDMVKSKATLPVSAAEAKAAQDDLQRKLDSVDEMSEATNLKLQMAMDRRNKLMEAASNIMKKIQATQDTIISNLK